MQFGGETGIDRAKGLVAILGEDKDNVFIVLSARGLKPPGKGYQFNPEADTLIQRDDVLVVIGTRDQIDALPPTGT